MQAVQAAQYGEPSILEFKEDVAEPTPKPNQVLVTVYAAGLNPFDAMVLAGVYRDSMPLALPFTVGGDLAGVITQLGEKVTNFKVGDEVYGSAIAISGGSGAYARLATMNAEKTALKPVNVNFVEAAALPVAGMTAVEAIADHIKLQPGQRILIHGGAGGVGHVAVQYAKSIGAQVITTVAGRDVEFVKRLGADEVVDYQTQQFEEIFSDLDAVFDTVGGAVSTKSYQVLKAGRPLVLIVSRPDEKLAQRHHVKVIRQSTDTSAPKLQRLARLVEKGTLKVHIDRTFTLDQTRAAFDHLATGHPQGKVVIKIKD
ncbi:MAG: NADPH:quinone reductase Zn-dependent oxidoreductase [Candidatus Pacebacteria bacterium GW2011_GWB1_47_8]|nr:MAG: NADPH:quinone reductase Zn-dependent oxidoreductase [Candidatus Pacebacteria bacterium GW2011_GWA1_46_10]KKU84238.1 MAG: NADPH:quinone reductase Zn-dependent oxidoreductase [Candidatus Pacebacteria bacterium GW2011_GWB1_47_8]HCR81458.1 hypothetical protein [Candidatus Paceibacterota bacterium]